MPAGFYTINLTFVCRELRTPAVVSPQAEVRQTAHDFLKAWAGGTEKLAQTVSELVTMMQTSFDPVALALTEEAPALAATFAGHQMLAVETTAPEVLSAIQDSAPIVSSREKYPDYDARQAAFIQMHLAQMEREAQQFFNDHPNSRDSYRPSYVMAYTREIEDLMRAYVNKIRQLQEKYGDRYQGSFALIASPNDDNKAFLSEMGRLGVKPISEGVIPIQNYLLEHGNALVYGLDGTRLAPEEFSPEFRFRIVASRLSNCETLLFAMVLGGKLATVSHIIPELLKHVPEVLQGTSFNGQFLEVFESPLDFVYQDYATRQLIATNA